MRKKTYKKVFLKADLNVTVLAFSNRNPHWLTVAGVDSTNYTFLSPFIWPSKIKQFPEVRLLDKSSSFNRINLCKTAVPLKADNCLLSVIYEKREECLTLMEPREKPTVWRFEINADYQNVVCLLVYSWFFGVNISPPASCMPLRLHDEQWICRLGWAD